MTTMDQIHRIRELYYEQGKNLIEIAIIMNCDWRTVRKYVDMENFNSNSPAPQETEHISKLDPFKPSIDSWMTADKKVPRKQRHTAKRVFHRLKDEVKDFDCSYRLVASLKFMVMMQMCKDNENIRDSGEEWNFEDIKKHRSFGAER